METFLDKVPESRDTVRLSPRSSFFCSCIIVRFKVSGANIGARETFSLPSVLYGSGWRRCGTGWRRGRVCKAAETEASNLSDIKDYRGQENMTPRDQEATSPRPQQELSSRFQDFMKPGYQELLRSGVLDLWNSRVQELMSSGHQGFLTPGDQDA